MFPDWRAQGVECACTSTRAGSPTTWPDARRRPGEEGARLVDGVRVTGFTMDGAGAVTVVHTDQGDISVEQVIVAVGPWVKSIWTMLGLPNTLDVRTPDGSVHADQEMWTYWYLQEGEIDVDPGLLSLPDGSMPPVLHVDSDAPLYDDDGGLITGLWGTTSARPAASGERRPSWSGTTSTSAVPTASVDSSFADMVRPLSLHEALEHRATAKNVRSGGVGLHRRQLPSSTIRPNAYVTPRPRYKMIGAGRGVARVVVGGDWPCCRSVFERFATGDLHPVSNSPTLS
jgi:hypothetical protein